MPSQPPTLPTSPAALGPTSGATSPVSVFLKPLSPARVIAKSPLASSFSQDYHDAEESGRPGKRPRFNPPPPMTAAAAMAEKIPREKKRKTPPSNQTSPNPATAALSALLGVTNRATSPADRVPGPRNPATTLSQPLGIVAESIQNPAVNEPHSDSQAQTSPVSLSSLGTLESMTAPLAAPRTTGDSPSQLDTSRDYADNKSNDSVSPSEGNRAFPYPATHLAPHTQDARRGMSLPGSGLRQGTRSPSSKKHRCPYCATEFTRHHNLKSHLLTHSQEKPYVCSTCQSRFRRLHDLKRHTKLHTGERPHICPKCGRKFARGDALARHNKGPGGCAGRRSSMGSFDGNDDYDGNDDSMDLMYGEPDQMDEEDGNERRPGIRKQGASGDDSGIDSDHFSRMPSTYPPIQGRPPGGIASGVFPPRPNFTGSGSSATGMSPAGSMPHPHPGGSASSTLYPPVNGAAVFGQHNISESPKPISPGSQPPRPPGPTMANTNPTRSPSLSQFAQQQYGRATGAPTPPASMGIHPGVPQLPPPHSLNPPDPRYTLPSQGGPAHPPTQPSGPPTHMGGSGPLSSHSNSHSSHGHSAQGSGDHAFASAKDDRLWAVVKSLETRMNSLQDEVAGLRAQLAATHPTAAPR